MNRALAVIVAALLHLPALAGSAPAVSTERSPLVRAMHDELQRSMTLTIPGMGRPYFVSYQVWDVEQIDIGGEFGGLIVETRHHNRVIETRVRVGGYEFDNTNFAGSHGGTQIAPVTLDDHDDSYPALRQMLWLATDMAYKRAAKAYEHKTAALTRSASKPDDPGDFSREPAVRFVVDQDQTPQLPPTAPLVDLVKHLSNLYWQFPGVQEGSVGLSLTVVRRHFVSSEGSLIYDPYSQAKLVVAAATQAEDGMPLRHFATHVVPQASDLPDRAMLEQEVRRVLGELTALRTAPLGTDYSGPVLFEGPAAGQIVRRLLAPHLSGTPAPRSQDGSARPSSMFEGKLGRRVLPAGFRVQDDPTLRQWRGQPLVGSYQTDYQGVKGQRVKLVEGGTLKAFLMTRTPRKGTPRSTGHARSPGWGPPRARISNLTVQAPGTSARMLRRRLVAEARKAGEDYGVVVKLLDAPRELGMLNPEGFGWLNRGRGGGVLVAYKVLPDGTESLIRGVSLDRLTPKSLKRILAAGRKSVVHNHGKGTAFFRRGGVLAPPTSVITPPLLFRDVELRPAQGTHRDPPLLARP